MTRANRREVVAGGIAAGITSGIAATFAGCAPRPRFDAEVIVIGAGLAGLYAARLLAAEGRDVLVLEADSRVGGRTLSFDVDGHTLEGGGEQIGSSYARVRDVADEEGLEIVADRAPLPTHIHLGGEIIPPDAWRDHPLNPMPDGYRDASPGSALFRAAAPHNLLADPGAWADLADMSAKAFLTREGFSAEAQRLIDHTLNGTALDSYGMANLFRSLALYRLDREGGPSGHMVGGMQRLSIKMAARLDVRLSTPVLAIHEDAHGVSVLTEMKGFRAPHVISSLPLPVYRRVEMRTAFDISPLVDAIPYTAIHQVHFRATPRDHNIWSDEPMERVFAHRDSEGTPSGLFRAWINGRGAVNRILSADARLAPDKALPKVMGEDVDMVRDIDWGPLNPLAGGAYRHFQPGQSRAFGRAFEAQSGRVRFAGEHTSSFHTGLEGAMESGEREAFRLLGV